MSDALTRAARAISRADHEAYCQSGHDNMEILDPEGAADCYVTHARAAILSFLSGEDVVEAAAVAIWESEITRHPDPDSFLPFYELRESSKEALRAGAKGAIAALRALVQEDGK